MADRLKREDLYEGRKVTYDELRDILDAYIILTDVTGYTPNLSGTIKYITEEKDERLDDLLFNSENGKCRCIFNSSFDLDEDISYDE